MAYNLIVQTSYGLDRFPNCETYSIIIFSFGVYMDQMVGSQKPPQYDAGVDYYKEFWRIYIQNENLVCDVDQTA